MTRLRTADLNLFSTCKQPLDTRCKLDNVRRLSFLRVPNVGYLLVCFQKIVMPVVWPGGGERRCVPVEITNMLVFMHG